MARNLNVTQVILAGLLLAGPAAGDEQPTPQEIQAAFVKAAGDYVISRTGADAPLKLYETPVLKWSNPERSEQQGIVFIWQEDGLPMTIGSFFTFAYRGLREKHEFHSLTDAPLSASFQGKTAWKPDAAGVQWKALPDHGAPAASKGVRLTQMRQIAAGFRVQLISPKGDRRELRLLRTPLFRFSSPAKGVADGAIFSFTVATDPEALLIVRATGDRWEYALARFHYWQLEATRNEKVVWSVMLDQGLEGNRLGDQAHMTKVFTSFYPERDYLFRR